MSRPERSNKSLFLAAIEIESDSERAAFLRQACGDNDQLREEIESLLDAHSDPPEVLKQMDKVQGSFSQPITEKPGTEIGPYKLLQQIGEGGMGVVYMAEQTEPVERRVALKIIKPGMDTRQVIGRFEAERQVLAMMDHPNIAKVLDAGTTDSGRPYFVMELVSGTPITDCADEHHLTPRQRLELFMPVCQAIQHAHQKGIIHRDIKPSNVLVAEYDDRPVPKVIDFGVAKAIEKRLTEKTMFTHYGQIVGTIGYMSPEQANLNQSDVDTRSDIYSLGVLLYELLTGETPFDRERLRSAAFDELLRIIREEDPPKPSLRLSSSDSLPSIAANRQVEPKKLNTLVRGELDWIVMKALEKDRTRRYETANGFARDVQRYLDDEPVEACPPSRAYRFRKFVRRNKAALVTTATVLAALLVGMVVSIWQANEACTARRLAERRLLDEQEARREADRQRELAGEQRKRAEAHLSLATHALAEAYRLFNRTGQPRDTASQEVFKEAISVLTAMTEQYPTNPEYFTRLAHVYRSLMVIRLECADAKSLLAASVRASTRAIELDPTDAEAYRIRGYGYMNTEEWVRASADLSQANELDPTDWLAFLRYDDVCTKLGRYEQALDAYNRSVELDSSPAHVQALICASRGYAYSELGRRKEALDDYSRSIRIDPSQAQVYLSRGYTYCEFGRYEEAIVDYDRSLGLLPMQAYVYKCRALAQLAGADIDGYRVDCAEMVDRFGQTEDGAKAYRTAWTCALAADAVADYSVPIALAEKAVKSDPAIGARMRCLGAILYRAGKLDQAIQRLMEADQLAASDPHSAWTRAYTWLFLAMAHHRLGQYDEALAWVGKAVELTDKVTQDNEDRSGRSLSWGRRTTMELLRQEAGELLGARTESELRGEKPNEQTKAPGPE